MEWYDDSIACLEVAKSMLIQVEEQQEAAIYDKDVLPYLKVTIKNTLENCRSPLDYAANYISKKYPPYSSKFTHPQFPSIKNWSNARNEIRERMNCVPSNEIINIIKSSQSNNKWLKNLTILVNGNKHNSLTSPDISGTSKINYMNIGGNHFYGPTFTGEMGGTVQINGKKYQGAEILNIHPGIEGEFSRKYYFTDPKLEVYPTLEHIILEVEKIIEKLNNELLK